MVALSVLDGRTDRGVATICKVVVTIHVRQPRSAQGVLCVPVVCGVRVRWCAVHKANKAVCEWLGPCDVVARACDARVVLCVRVVCGLGCVRVRWCAVLRGGL